jgi:predicted nuclease with RNAse H fold
MDETHALAPYSFAIDSAVAEWLHRAATTGSARMAIEYERTIRSFRQFLARAGLDLLPTRAQTQEAITRRAIDLARVAAHMPATRARSHQEGWHGKLALQAGFARFGQHL